MKIAILGRTRWLIDAADACFIAGHEIVAVATARPEPFYKCESDEFSLLSKRTGAAYFGEVSLKNPEVQKKIKATGADIAVSINWPTILSAEVISLFQYGIINAHCGDLPRYRGNACPNWAILNGEPYIGLCVHNMIPEEVDAGPILLKDYLPVSDAIYITDVYKWLDVQIPKLLVIAITGLAKRTIQKEYQPSDPNSALRCYPRRPEDGRINWEWDAERIHRLIRASSRPFEGAFGYFEKTRKLTIWKAEILLHHVAICAIPGQILFMSEGYLVVTCGSGFLRLTEIELEGECGHSFSTTVLTKSMRNRLN